MLEGHQVLITGGGSGVGADLARGFAEAGAGVVIVGRRREPLEKVAALTGAKIVVADITDPISVTSMFRNAGICDIVIANAGAAESNSFLGTTLDQWDRMIAVNLTGVFLTLQAGLSQMSSWGRLISIASTAGLKGYAKVAPYVAAKHGVVGLTRALALELARRPVTVNALCPGFLDTPMTDRSITLISEKTGRTTEEARRLLMEMNPQGRLIEPVEVTRAALWLCGPNSDGINGQAIAIAGGEL